MSTATALYDQTRDSPNSVENRKFCIHHKVLVNNHIPGCMFITLLQISYIFRYSLWYLEVSCYLWWWIPQCQQQQLQRHSTTNTANTLPLFLWFLPVLLIFCCLIL